MDLQNSAPEEHTLGDLLKVARENDAEQNMKIGAIVMTVEGALTLSLSLGDDDGFNAALTMLESVIAKLAENVNDEVLGIVLRDIHNWIRGKAPTSEEYSDSAWEAGNRIFDYLGAYAKKTLDVSETSEVQ